MVKQLKCFRRFRVRKGARTFWKRFRSLPKYLWPFRVRKGAGNSEAVPKWHFQNEISEAPEPLCGSWLNTVSAHTNDFKFTVGFGTVRAVGEQLGRAHLQVGGEGWSGACMQWSSMHTVEDLSQDTCRPGDNRR